MRYTPGPWLVTKMHGECVIECSHETIAHIDTLRDADALLIAASPELAEALLALVRAVEDQSDMGIGANEDVILKAREVLKKAGIPCEVTA